MQRFCIDMNYKGQIGEKQEETMVELREKEVINLGDYKRSDTKQQRF
jgi:hypothetical protein